MADNNQNRHVVDSELIKKQSKVLEAYKQATAELEEKLGKENSNHSTEEEVQIKPNEDKNNNLI
ncbi:MAG UNVERIFIED_CONTAM: hypothetical protein LVQ98_01265 [Rickettsiaceae bacterium]